MGEYIGSHIGLDVDSEDEPQAHSWPLANLTPGYAICLHIFNIAKHLMASSNLKAPVLVVC